MELRVLNGISRVTKEDTDLSRIYVDIADPNYILDGLSLNNYSLNGYTLNGEEIDMVEEYCLECERMGNMPTMQGYLNGRAERKAKKAARKQKRAVKKAQKTEKKEARREKKTERQFTKTRRREARTQKKESRAGKREFRESERAARREGRQAARLARQLARDERKMRRQEMSPDLMDIAQDIGTGLIDNGEGDFAPSGGFSEDRSYDTRGGGLMDIVEETGLLPEEYEQELADYIEQGQEIAGEVDERGLFRPPSLFKQPGKWFASNKIPVWQKIGVVAGTTFIADQALNKGKITKSIMGKKGKKSK